MIKFFKYFFLVLLLALVVAVGMTYVYNDKIKSYLIEALNKELSGELEVKGFEITILSSLPNARAEFQSVVLKDKNGKTFLSAEVLGFDLSLFSLTGSNPKINKVVIKDGDLDIIRYKNGKFNTDILNKKESTEVKSNSLFKLSLKEAKLINTRIHYVDKKDNIDTQLKVKDALFSGEFAKDKFILYSKAESTIMNLVSNQKTLYKSLPLNYETVVYVDFAKGNYRISETEMNLGVLDLKADGEINKVRGGYEVDLLMNSMKSNLTDVFSVMPTALVAKIAPFTSKGEVSFSADVKGAWFGNLRPEVLVELKMENGSVEWAKLGKPLEQLSFDLKLHNLDKTFNISSKNILCNWYGEEIKGTLNVNDILNPNTSITLDGAIHLEAFNKTLASNNIKFNKGVAGLSKANIIIKEDDIKFSSNVLLKGVDLLYNKIPLVIDSADLTLSNKDILIKKSHFDNKVMTGELNGRLVNATHALLNTKDDHVIKLDLDLNGNKIDLDSVLELLFGEKENKTTASKDNGRLETTGEVRASFKSLTYQKVKTEQIDVDLTLYKNKFDIEGDAAVFEGNISLEGDLTYSPQMRFYSTIDCQNVEAETLFESFNNFDQEVVQSKNINGKITSAIETNIFWDKNGALDKKRMEVIGAFSIEQGELIGLKMFDDFANYVHIKDLRHIKFDKLQNWLHIKGGKIYIPNMFIHSNAVNMTVCGTHNFDNMVQYNIKLNAARVLINRYFNDNPHRKFQPKKEDKFFNLFFTLDGPLAKIETKSNRKRVKRKFELFESRQLKIKDQLTNALGKLNFMDSEPQKEDEATEVYDDDEEDDVDDYDEDVEADEDYIIDGF